MEMCPYCGEEVPADSPKCWKCGTELEAGSGKGAQGAGGSDELEVPDDEDGGDGEGGGGQEKIPCPHCESPVPKKAQRCRECGRMLREVKTNKAAAAWRLGTWLIVGGVGIAIAIGVVVASKKRRLASQDRPIAKIEYADLEKRIQPLSTVQKDRKRELWTRDFEGKFVKWSGTVTEVNTETGHVKVSLTKATPNKADVDVEFREDGRDDLKDLNPNQPIGYSARLADFGKDGVAFTLTDGLIEK